MIQPIAFYRYPILLGISNTSNDKLEPIQVRALLPNLVTSCYIWIVLKQYDAVDVFKSVNHIGKQSNEVIFQGVAHGKNTRGNGSFSKLPKIRKQLERSHLPIRGH